MEEEKNYIKVTECENAVTILEKFLDTQGVVETLEQKKCKYNLHSLNVPATIAAFRLFYMITRDLIPDSNKISFHYKLNISLLNYILTDDHFKDICIYHNIDVILANGFSLDYGFIWYPRKVVDDYAF